MLNTFRDFGFSRLLTHAALFLLTLAAVGAARLYAPRGELAYLVTLGCGYLSVALIAATLMIGTFNLLRQRRNPVNLMLRRDVGIWAGITGLLHVFFGFQLHRQGQIFYYFFEAQEDGSVALITDLFGLSNWVGAAAALLLLLLLVISNDLSLRRLKGGRWKALQRLNYALAGLAALHTIGYQMVSGRETGFTYAFVALVALALAAQLAGALLMRQRVR
jgi:sulfoxide reductase heme-binding subunit YedZ